MKSYLAQSVALCIQVCESVCVNIYVKSVNVCVLVLNYGRERAHFHSLFVWIPSVLVCVCGS